LELWTVETNRAFSLKYLSQHLCSHFLWGTVNASLSLFSPFCTSPNKLYCYLKKKNCLCHSCRSYSKCQLSDETDQNKTVDRAWATQITINCSWILIWMAWTLPQYSIRHKVKGSMFQMQIFLSCARLVTPTKS
jgi:hypothetical protein